MSMDTGGGGGGMKSEPNVVPLCDILLVLLIIFMVITPMLQKGVDVRLPEAANSGDQPDPTGQVTVAIKLDGTIFLNAEPIPDRKQLKDKLNDIFENKTEKVLYFKADSELEYGDVLDVLDEIMKAGIENVGVVTDQLTNEEDRALVTE